MRSRFFRIAVAAFSALTAACSESVPVSPSLESNAPRLNGAGTASGVRIAEFHYDNTGTDAGEFIEVSGPAGFDVTGWQIVRYNGSNPAAAVVYGTTLSLSGLIPNTCVDRGVLVINLPTDGLQNGGNDGFALVDAAGVVVELLSYEGTFTAAAGAGPAAGLTSTDVGVVQTASTPVGASLQRDAAGTWTSTTVNTSGACNDNGTTTPPAVVASVVVSPSTAGILVGATQAFTAAAFDANGAAIPGVSFTWTSGDPLVATVSANGLATAIAAGATTITAAAANGVSGSSALTVSDLPPPPPLPPVRFTEVHYDNVGADVNEQLEIEGPAGTDLTGWHVVLYNGSDGRVYDTFTLTGLIPNSCSGRGTVVVRYPQDGLQNGAPDGFALVDAANAVVEFLSYEGTFVATNGPASGQTSIDLGVSETGGVFAQSLQRNANGVWQSQSVANFGVCNGTGTVPPQGGISFTGRTFSDPDLPVGFEDQLFATVRDGSGATVTSVITWSSDTPGIVSVNADGVVRALSVGTGLVRATAANGASGLYRMPTVVATPGAAVYANHAEFGEPTDGDASDDFIVRRTEFTSSYNVNRGTPNWVSYNLEATHIDTLDRCDCFTFDPLLPANFTRYTTADYTGGGFDRGHLARSFDRTSGSLDNARSFYFTNIVPQYSALNSGPWGRFETYLGNLALQQNKEVFIVTGVAGNLGTIKNEGLITIPASTWKVAVILPRDQGLSSIVTGREAQVLAVIMPNVTTISGDPWEMYQTTVDAVEALSGYDLLALLPDGIESQLERGNRFPLAVTNGPFVGSEGSVISMSGSASSDPDAGDVLTYNWSFGDGTSASGATVNKSYVNNGVYTVTLTVTDTHGAQSVVTTSATVSNVAPTPVVTPPSSWRAGVAGVLGVRFTDPGTRDAPFIVRINWGDGTPVTTYASTIIPPVAQSRPHRYLVAGTYTVTVTVTDRDGGVGSYSFVATVAP